MSAADESWKFNLLASISLLPDLIIITTSMIIVTTEAKMLTRNIILIGIY